MTDRLAPSPVTGEPADSDLLRAALEAIIRTLGPKAHAHEAGFCEGCEYEINDALDLARAALAASGDRPREAGR